MAADEEIGPETEHFLIEVGVKHVTWVMSKAAAAGGRGFVDGPPTRRVRTLTKVITTSADVEAAVSKAKRMLDIEIGEDA